MYCPYCGEELKNRARFCPKCGKEHMWTADHQVKEKESETAENKMTGNKKTCKRILTAVILIAFITGGTLAAVSVRNQKIRQEIAEKLELGDESLEKADYENAIEAYSRVIKLDGENADAYLGRGQAYLAKGKMEEDYEAALSDYETVLELETDCEEAYWGMAKVYTKQKRDAEALEMMYGLADDTEMLTEEKKSELKESCLELADRAEVQGDIDSLYEIYNFLGEIYPYDAEYSIRIDWLDAFIEYKGKLLTMITAMESAALGEEEFDFSDEWISGSEYDTFVKYVVYPMFCRLEDGEYLAVYPGGGIYLGNMDDRIRKGEGKWFFGSKEAIVYVECQWENDLPNGSFSEIILMEKEWAALMEANMKVECKGTAVDGVLEGECIKTYEEIDGTIHEFRPTYVNGYMEPNGIIQGQEYGAYCQKHADCGLYLGEGQERIAGF